MKAIPGTRLAWSTLTQWADLVARETRNCRRGAKARRRLERLVESLNARDIQACEDLRTLHRADTLIRDRRQRAAAGSRTATGYDQDGRDLLVEIHNRKRAIITGAAFRPARRKGPRLDPARLPLERVDALIQSHPCLALVEALRGEKLRRERAA